MNLLKFMNFFVIWFTHSIHGAVYIIPDQILEDCSPENTAQVFDFSEFELIPENDTTTFIHGKWKFNKDLVAPWKGSLTTEKYDRGQWLIQAFNRKYADICPTLQNPLEPFYNVFKDVSGCPAKAGTSWDFDMVPITFSKAILQSIPPHYAGRWRANFVSIFQNENGEIYEECKRAYADLYYE